MKLIILMERVGVYGVLACDGVALISQERRYLFIMLMLGIKEI